MPELLAPAGSWEALEAAVDAAAKKKEAEMLGFLMDERRRLFPGKKKVFEL